MYYRLSGFYLFYFAALGALVPYWGLYLKSLGYRPEQIGELFAILMATKMLAPYLWAWIADHTGRRMFIIRLVSLLALFAFAGIYRGGGFWWLALVMMAFSFFWNAALPQFEAVTMSYLGHDTHRYSVIRLWGSVGFIVSAAGLGYVLQDQGARILPDVMVLLLLGIWLSSLLVPEQPVPVDPHGNRSILGVIRQPVVLALLLICFLMQFSHGPYYTFYSIYLEAHGYSRVVIGQLWALGVLAEIGVFLIMHRLLPRFGVRVLLLLSLSLTTVRWLLLALFVDYAAWMVAAQILHAASFGVYHVVAITLIHQFFPGRHQGRGQALYSSLSFGAGGAAGSLVSGYSWAHFGPESSYLLAAAASTLAAWIAWRTIRGYDVRGSG